MFLEAIVKNYLKERILCVKIEEFNTPSFINKMTYSKSIILKSYKTPSYLNTISFDYVILIRFNKFKNLMLWFRL